MKRTPLVAATAILVIASTAVIATAHDRGGEGPRGPGRADVMFEQFDLNADGQVTRDEITAAGAKRFAEADSNGDGQLSPEEITAAAEARRAEMRERRGASRIERMMERHDANDDGTLSLEEMTKAAGEDRMERMFDHLDADEDGAITKAELDEMQGKRGSGRWFKRQGHDRGYDRGYRHGHGDRDN